MNRIDLVAARRGAADLETAPGSGEVSSQPEPPGALDACLPCRGPERHLFLAGLLVP
jgi:hypothetical protein